MKTVSRLLVALVLCSIIGYAPAIAAPVGEPVPVNVTSLGVQQTLANAVAASTNQVFASNAIGRPRTATLCVSASGATTFTVTESTSNVLFYAGTIADSATTANVVFAGAGTLCENITPASYIKVATSAAVTVSVEIQAAF